MLIQISVRHEPANLKSASLRFEIFQSSRDITLKLAIKLQLFSSVNKACFVEGEKIKT